MPDSFGERKYFGNPVWMWFVRGTMALAWIVGTWAMKTLFAVDRNQALMTEQLTQMNRRVEKLESRNEERDKEERDRLYRRAVIKGVQIP